MHPCFYFKQYQIPLFCRLWTCDQACLHYRSGKCFLFFTAAIVFHFTITCHVLLFKLGETELGAVI